MTSSQSVLFNLAVEMLPNPLASATVKNGLMNPAVFSYSPRKTAEELGLAPEQESKVRKVTESVGVDGIGYGGIAYFGAMATGHGSGIVSVQNVPILLCGFHAQVESQSDGVSPNLVKTCPRNLPRSPCTPARPASHLPTQQPQHNSPVLTRYRQLHHHPSTFLQPLFKRVVSLHFHPTPRLPPPHRHFYPFHWATPAQISEVSKKWKIRVTSRGIRSFAKKNLNLRRRMKSSELGAHQMARAGVAAHSSPHCAGAGVRTVGIEDLWLCAS